VQIACHTRINRVPYLDPDTEAPNVAAVDVHAYAVPVSLAVAQPTELLKSRPRHPFSCSTQGGYVLRDLLTIILGKPWHDEHHWLSKPWQENIEDTDVRAVQICRLSERTPKVFECTLDGPFGKSQTFSACACWGNTFKMYRLPVLIRPQLKSCRQCRRLRQ